MQSLFKKQKQKRPRRILEYSHDTAHFSRERERENEKGRRGRKREKEREREREGVERERERERFVKQSYYITKELVCIHPTPLPQTQFDTRSIFKWSKASMNLEFSVF